MCIENGIHNAWRMKINGNNIGCDDEEGKWKNGRKASEGRCGLKNCDEEGKKCWMNIYEENMKNL